MITNEDQVLKNIEGLPRTVANATNLPDDLRLPIASFGRLLNVLHDKYHSEQDKYEKAIIYAATVGFVSQHIAIIKEIDADLGSYTAQAYSRIYTPEPKQAYFMAMSQFVAKHEERSLMHATFSSGNYVKKYEEGQTLKFYLGARLNKETDEPPTSIDQLIGRMIPSRYLNDLKVKAEKYIERCNLGTHAAIAVICVAAPFSVAAVSSLFCMYKQSEMTDKAQKTLSSISQAGFKDKLSAWEKQTASLLKDPTSMQVLISNSQQRAPRQRSPARSGHE